MLSRNRCGSGIRVDLDAGEVDVLWQAILRRFDIEHTFRMLQQTLGWTWLLLAAYTQLRWLGPHRRPQTPVGETRCFAKSYTRTCSSGVSAPPPESGPSRQRTETLLPRTG